MCSRNVETQGQLPSFESLERHIKNQDAIPLSLSLSFSFSLHLSLFVDPFLSHLCLFNPSCPFNQLLITTELIIDQHAHTMKTVPSLSPSVFCLKCRLVTAFSIGSSSIFVVPFESDADSGFQRLIAESCILSFGETHTTVRL